MYATKHSVMHHIIFAIFLLGVTLATSAAKLDNHALNNIKIAANIKSNNNIISSRNDRSLEESFRQYMKQEKISFQLPIGATLTLNEDEDEEFNLKLRFNSGNEEQARKKSKIKKILIPVLIFILLKAMTLIPLALGVLGIKTWNAIQLSFISFLSALAMAVWKLCAKVNHDPHPQIIHDAWDSHYHDRYDSEQIAYSAYA